MKKTAIDKLIALAEYWDGTRQVGHTSAMMCGARSVPNAMVIIAVEAERTMIESVGIDIPKRQQCITVANLGRDTLAGQRGSPCGRSPRDVPHDP